MITAAWIYELFTIAIASLGFAIFFNIHTRNILPATLGGVLAWFIYLVSFSVNGSMFLSNMLASLFVGIWAEIMARVMRAPANVFVPVGVIPMLPGGALYYAMTAIMAGDIDGFRQFGAEALTVACGIASGVLVSFVLMLYYFKIVDRVNKNKFV